MSAPVIAMLNMKGGVGKTTIAVHMSRELHEAKRASVLLVDLDPQFNLTQQLFTEEKYESLISSGKSIMRAFEPAPNTDFFDINISNKDTPNARDISDYLYYFKDNPTKTLSILPGSFDLTKYSLIPDPPKLKHASAFFKKFISNARKDFDYIILDLNPSSSFITTAGLSVATDILAPVRPDKYSVLGLRLVRKLIEQPNTSNAPQLHVVMNVKSRSDSITPVEKTIRADDYFGDKLLVNRVYHSGLLEARHDYTGFASDKKVKNRITLKKELRALAIELSGRVKK